MDADLHQKVMLALIGKTATKGADAAIRIVVEACARIAEINGDICDEEASRLRRDRNYNFANEAIAEATGSHRIAAAIRGIVK